VLLNVPDTPPQESAGPVANGDAKPEGSDAGSDDVEELEVEGEK
jgi:hypothetical protein